MYTTDVYHVTHNSIVFHEETQGIRRSRTTGSSSTVRIVLPDTYRNSQCLLHEARSAAICLRSHLRYIPFSMLRSFAVTDFTDARGCVCVLHGRGHITSRVYLYSL